MRRWLPAVLALVLVAVLVFLGYQAYTAYQGLQARVAALEAQVQGQGEALKALSERVARLEEEVFRTPAEPLVVRFSELNAGNTHPQAVAAAKTSRTRSRPVMSGMAR